MRKSLLVPHLDSSPFTSPHHHHGLSICLVSCCGYDSHWLVKLFILQVAGMHLIVILFPYLIPSQDMQCVENCSDPDPSKHVLFEQPVWVSIYSTLYFLIHQCSWQSESVCLWNVSIFAYPSALQMFAGEMLCEKRVMFLLPISINMFRLSSCPICIIAALVSISK